MVGYKLVTHGSSRSNESDDVHLDHFISAMFVSGAAGDLEDENAPAELGAEDWELGNMCNSQYTFGSWTGVAA